jgi:hypothetical protein
MNALTQNGKMLHDGQLERYDILIVNPVFCRTSHKGILISSSRRITFDRMTSCPYEIKQFRELDNEMIVIHAIEWMRFQELLVERWFQ